MSERTDQLITSVKSEFDEWLSQQDGWHISQKDLASIERQISAIKEAYWSFERFSEVQRLRQLVKRLELDENALFPSLDPLFSHLKPVHQGDIKIRT